MTEVKIDITKSIEKNAEHYFERSKKLKKKVERTKKAIKRLEKKKDLADKKQKKREQARNKPERKKEWYEKFHWFFSSEGFLVIGGRDATSNEIIIKKHTDKDDIVLHTDASGSPFFVIKSKGKEPSEKTIREAAIATASYSKAWKLGLGSLEVFHVSPDQVTKETKAGEYISKGSFMIYGNKEYMRPLLGLALGIYKNKVMAAPLSAIKKHCKEYVQIMPGRKKKSTIAKKAKKKLEKGHLDEYISVIPSGGSEIR